MSDLKLLSVIIPAYNTEKYLEKCVESAVNQTYKNIEIIIVDDGSSDSTPQICDELANKYDNIKVIHKENQGVNTARAAGLHASHGDYIAFIDSDDYLDLNAYETAIKILENNNCDMVQFGAYIVDENGKILSERTFPAITLDEPRDLFLYFSCTITGVWSLCDKVYKRDILNGIEWLGTVMADDYYCSAQLFLKVKKFMTMEELFYYYVQHPSSIMHQPYIRRDKREDCINGHDIVINLTRKNFPEFVPDLLIRKIENIYVIFMEYADSNAPDKHEVMKQLKSYIRNDYKTMSFELKKQQSNLSSRPKLDEHLSRQYTLKDSLRIRLLAYCPSLYKFYLKTRLKIKDLTGI